MMSRAFLVVAGCFAFASAESSYTKYECYVPDTMWCEASGTGQKCCQLGWALDTSAGTCHSPTGESCDLCFNGVVVCPDFEPYSTSSMYDADGAEITAKAVAASADSSDGYTTVPGNSITSFVSSYSGQPGWRETTSTFYFPHDSLIGIGGGIPTFLVPATYSIRFDCDAAVNEETDSCNLYMFLYRCDRCETFSGKLPEVLLASEYPMWYINHCGPTFQLSDSTAHVQHPFVTYIAEVTPATYDVSVGPEEVQFMFWGHIRKSVTCGSFYTEEDCNDPLCRWESMEEVCLPSICPPPRPFVGPFERCQVCVGDPEAQEQLPAVVEK